MPIPPHRATSDGIRFEASGSTPAYLSMNQHRGGAHAARNRWLLSPPEEYTLFETSHTARWLCGDHHNWGIRAGLEIVGMNEERVAKFPRPSNQHDDRHGYPVSARDHNRRWEHRPPPELTSAWVTAQLISPFEKNRIDKGKV